MWQVGVLDLQGGVAEHIQLLEQIPQVQSVPVKRAEQIHDLDGLIIPGGESTTIGKLIKADQLEEPIKNLAHHNKPIWGTCAGLVLLANEVESQPDSYLQLIDITVRRNAYGSQLNSFICYELIEEVADKPIEMIFIRAPIIARVGPGVKILAKVNGEVVAAEQGNIIVTAFHPELTDNPSFHRYFVSKLT